MTNRKKAYGFICDLPGGGSAHYAVTARSEASARRYLKEVLHIRMAKFVGVWEECPPAQELLWILHTPQNY
ncbi:MAG: hypothetical protein N2556_09940 [Anaerolineae bacterium]|nr:hypothetical protein [Anaerolineae bacterium]